MKTFDPIYVRVTEMARLEDVQTSACCFSEVASNTPSCHDMKDVESLRISHLGTAESRTLLIAYLPRCACAKEVQYVFERFGTVCAANIICDGHGQSRCFGFVQLKTHEAARAALKACAKGHVILEDKDFKAWHIKASWAKTEHKRKGSQLAAVIKHSTRSNGQMASKAATCIASKGSRRSHGMKWPSSGLRAPLPPGLVQHS